MDLSKFYAGEESAPFAGFDEGARQVKLYTKRIGSLDFSSGLVGVSDPFVTDEHFLRFETPEGDQRGEVFATQADVSLLQDDSHHRIAYLSVIFSREEPADILPAVPAGHEDSELSEGHAFGVPVDAGTVSFFDSEDMLSYISAIDEDEQERITQEWINELYGEDESGTYRNTAKVTFPLSDGFDSRVGTLLLSSSGWGDGFYPVYKTVDARGKVLGFHIDLQVVGE